MDTIDGAWIMKGCGRNSPDRLYTPEDLLALVERVGFLPLFSNEIPGFSVEEHTPAGDWWTDDPASDPWAWRQILASNTHVAYGKFFDKKAGFVSAEWFPDFANVRRDGYDYEGFYEDGKMKHRNRQIMDAFELNDQCAGKKLLTCDLKKRAGVTKGFEGAVTELEMQTFLIVGDFRQRENRLGIPYGWHISELMTPETKWGYDAVNGCGRTPEASRDRIRKQILQFYPEVDERALRKVMGFR